MAASRKRVRVAPNLYQRGDGVYVAGLTINGKWTMKTLSARTKREAKQEVARLRVEGDSTAAASAQPTVFADVAEQFISHYEAKVARASLVLARLSRICGCSATTCVQRGMRRR